MSPSLSKSPNAAPRLDFRSAMPGSGLRADIFEATVAEIAVDQSRIAVGFLGFSGSRVELRIDVTVHLKDVGETVVIQVGECHAPADVLRVDRKSRPHDHILEDAVAQCCGRDWDSRRQSWS